MSQYKANSLCYATGKKAFCNPTQPSVSGVGGNQNVFSADDDVGFTFRGRFEDDNQALSIGFEFSSKMHNALNWLISNRAVSIFNKDNSRKLVAWESTLKPLPKFLEASETLIDDLDMDFEECDDTFANYKDTIQKAVFGFEKPFENLSNLSYVMLLVLEVTTKGRISVTLFDKIKNTEFYKNVTNWHTDTAWNRFNFLKKENYIGSFALPQIAEYACGI